MCSIIGSYDIKKVRELTKLNEYRGQHSHSFFVLLNNKIVYSHKDYGELNINNHLHKVDNDQNYYIVHQQAPTSSQVENTIHPAQLNGHYLWHNGIIKNNCVNKLQSKYKSTSNWDTQLLLYSLIENHKPIDIDGTFACLWLDPTGDVYVFRNEISPLFMDDDFNISSTMFDGSHSVPVNTMLRMNMMNKMIQEVDTFKTIENPYFFVS